MPTKLRSLTILILALAAGCWRGGVSPAPPAPLPPAVVVTRGPCLTAPPPRPPPSLATIPDAGAMTPEQIDALWAYLDALERRVARDWRLCGLPSTSTSSASPGTNP